MFGSVKISRKVKSFRANEKITVKGENYFEAFFNLGLLVKEQVRNEFSKLTKNFDVTKMATELNKAQKKLDYLKEISDRGLLKVDGVNYLQRYLNAFYGTSQAVGLSYSEAMIIQSEDVGCQTVMVQEKATGEIRMIHAEEDSSHDRKKDEYRYRWVDLEVGSNKIGFFYYPELFGFGPAVGVNETTGMVLAVDDLIAKEEFGSNGNFPVMAVAFMILDCGDVTTAKEIIDRMKRLPEVSLEGGYAIHMAQAKENPEMASVECIKDQFVWETYQHTEDRVFAVQSNFAVNEELSPMVMASIPETTEWRMYEARLFEEMANRRIRLAKQASEVNWLGKDAEESVEDGIRLLANPEGDTNQYFDEKGKLQKCYTGLPSPWVLAHFSVYLGSNELKYEVGKYQPKALADKPYSINYKEDYPFGGKDLLGEAEKDAKKLGKTII